MDALSALGIAGTVTQFVSFAGDLISKASELHGTANSSTPEVQNIDNVYSTLLDFSHNLQHANRDLSELESNSDARKLLGLVNECRRDCDKLLHITRTLQLDGINKTWYSCLRKAIESTWKLPEIRLLDERLQRTQLTLVLLVCSISSEFQHIQKQRIERLQEDGGLHRLNQDRQFAELQHTLQSIQSQLASLQKIDSGSAIPRIQYPSHVMNLEKQMQRLCIDTNDIQKQQAILDTLSFDALTVRYQAISEAHPGTFQWAFLEAETSSLELEEEERQDEIEFLDWLRYGQGVFWVTGRPGSGKSTFLKHVADHPKTRAALREWSGASEPVISSHYFWIFGTPMQKSKEGLWRALLFGIFRQYPTLLKVACPDRWDSDFSSTAAAKPWSTTELRNVLDSIISLAKDVKMCFFVDGLDEYNGDYLEVSEELSRLSKLDNVKCCISSRPWNVFHDAFGQDKSQQLCLHNLTKRDIRHYVHDRLTPHPRWQRLVDQTAYDSQLIDYITEKSHGVFLWVTLATDKLRNGLTNDDDLSDLSTRLAKFPSDLESFFDHILQTVEPFYHEKMAGTLRLARTADKPLNLQFYEFHDIEYRDDEYYLHVKRPRVDGASESAGDRVQRRLNAYCKGLLEVHGDRVEFLHRTVADYLSLPHVEKRLSGQSPGWFHPELSLAKVHLAYTKILPPAIPHRHHPGRYDTGPVDEHVRAVLHLASLHDAGGSAARETFRLLLYEMESSLNFETSEIASPHTPTSDTTPLYFRERLLQSRLPNYLEKRLLVDPNYLDSFDWPPLAVVMEEGCPSQHVSTIRLLLEHGQNPNQEFDIQVSSTLTRTKTPWTALLALLVRQTRDGLASRLLPYFSACLRAGIFDLFLDHGADPNASVYRREGQPHTTAWIDILFGCFEIADGVTEDKDQERYLSVLARLLHSSSSSSHEGGASVDGVIPLGPESNAHDESASETVLKRFFQLAQVLLPKPHLHSPRTRTGSDFVVRVSELLVRRACWARWPLDAVWPEVMSAFGDAETRHLRRVYDRECKLRRRRVVAEWLGVPLVKRAVCLPFRKGGMGKY